MMKKCGGRCELDTILTDVVDGHGLFLIISVGIGFFLKKKESNNQ